MTILDEYLEKIQNKESIFPMDSPHTGKPASKYVLTGDEKDDEDDEQIPSRVQS